MNGGKIELRVMETKIHTSFRDYNMNVYMQKEE